MEDIIQVQMNYEFITGWLKGHGLAIVFILIGALLAKKFGMKPVGRFIRGSIKHHRFSSQAEAKRREDTLIEIADSVLNVIIIIIAGALILEELNLDIGPILAGAGLFGVAIGFGAQETIKDWLTGYFIITENQYRVGDVVDLDGKAGLVEDISLRMTVLRDLDGIVHHVPNGAIKVASNFSKGYARVNLNVAVSYDSDLDHVIEVINRIGMEMSAEDEWKTVIIDPPSFMRVDSLGDSSIQMKIVGEVKPLEQWNVSGELRKRLKQTFDKEGIEIPFPQQVVHQPTILRERRERATKSKKS